MFEVWKIIQNTSLLITIWKQGVFWIENQVMKPAAEENGQVVIDIKILVLELCRFGFLF